MTEEEWAGWLAARWAVIPMLEGVPPDKDDTPAGWVIVQARDVLLHAAEHLGPIYEDEETARHIARCHNWWRGSLPRPEKTDDEYSQPAPGRASVP